MQGWTADQLIGGALGVLLGFGPVVTLIAARRSLGAVRTAAYLVVWGAVIAGGEHAWFALLEALGEPGDAAAEVSPHARYHFLMAGVYAALFAVSLAVVAGALLRHARRAGWFAVLAALIVGGSAEILAASTVFPHGFPPRSLATGLAIYAYPVAWASALLIAYRPVFDPSAGEQAHRDENA